jgi:hypothetical protein
VRPSIRHKRKKATHIHPRTPPFSSFLINHSSCSRLKHSMLPKHASGEVPRTSEPRTSSLTFHLNLCNTILGITGLAVATCFGVITIVQSQIANKEAKRSNDIAFQSLLLSGFATCAQLADSPVSSTAFHQSSQSREDVELLTLPKDHDKCDLVRYFHESQLR